ncbi:carbohydrate ABC transporter permease [Anaerotalea alkaliphila]|uniref:Carbohydrate ABC transporter permease n=1 Tax=Anaerotalea alkaliphila TaxID=2662126 RepID=A0A7X5KMJ1_9FIRM|nr:carbohydrate ABC transporter permease [Anaerotalea alkaliphila]NDL68041.1 carbohydrate ABC transporter permease [Anaerotalea alkaliphila]
MVGKKGKKASQWIVFAVLVVISVLALAPFAFMVISSFKPGQELLRNGVNMEINLDAMSWKNYWTLFTENNGIYLHWFKNSLLITGMYTGFSLFLSSIVGYGLAKYDFKGKNLVFAIVLLVMMVPVEILILPLYKLMISMKLIDTYLGVVLPFMVSPFAVFFFRQSSVSIPKDFMEAARIDGCGEFRIFFSIMMPLLKPAFGAMMILQAMNSWNSLVWPLIVLRSTEKLTLPIGLASLITPYGNNYDMLFPGAVMSIIPIVIIFMLNQKAFIEGLTVGGVKG